MPSRLAIIGLLAVSLAASIAIADDVTRPNANRTTVPAQAAADGFLTNTWRDALGLVGLASVLLTVVGLWVGFVALRLTQEQMRQATAAARHATSVAEAATQAALDATRESREQYNRYVVSYAANLVHEANLFVKQQQWTLAALRLGDLVHLVTHIADRDAAWSGFARRLESMEHSFERIEQQRERAIGPGLQGKWRKLRKELLTRIARRYGPFQSQRQDDRHGSPAQISRDPQESSEEVEGQPGQMGPERA